MPWAWSRKERTEQEGGEQCPHWQCPSGLGKKDADSRARKGDAGPGPAGLPLPAGGEAGGSARRESGQEIVPSGGLAATEQSHWKVLDMGGPLGRQLEELDVTPLDSVDGHSQHGLLLLGGADEAADALDDLALGIYLLFSRFLAQEDGGNFLVLLFGDYSHCHGAGKLGFPTMGQAGNLH